MIEGIEKLGAELHVRPFLIQARILTDRSRGNSYKQAERKLALGKAPAYMYLWKWPAKAFNGQIGAVHGTDVALAFHSPHGELTGDGQDARRLADELGGAWVAFARTAIPTIRRFRIGLLTTWTRVPRWYSIGRLTLRAIRSMISGCSGKKLELLLSN